MSLFDRDAIHGWDVMTKRLFDLLAASCGLLVFAPILCVLSILIWATSPGPVFYRGRRAGRNGRPFHILKFRTMVMNADKIGGPSTSDRDPRITSVGHFMRKFKLDELPQLMNVIWGDMSLVGPRPQVVNYVERFVGEERDILTVRPGITDWASIWNSDEGAILAQYSDPDRAYDEVIHPIKTKIQLMYVRNHSLLTDLKIILYTLARIVRKDFLPAELAPFPKLGVAEAPQAESFVTVTETPGTGAPRAQISMLHTRYRLAGDLAAGKDVLELACGSGIGLGHLATRARRTVGGDCDAKLVDLARKNVPAGVEVLQLDAQSLPFESASFDVVLLLEAIYYLPDPDAFLRETKRVLRPGGVALIGSANCERTDFNRSPFSQRYFSASELRGMLKKHGFQPQILAGFPIAAAGMGGRIRHAVRQFAVKYHLIPKTMWWKAVVKRLVFGELQPLPQTLGQHLPEATPLTEVSAEKCVDNYEVLYAVGYLAAQEQSLAA